MLKDKIKTHVTKRKNLCGASCQSSSPQRAGNWHQGKDYCPKVPQLAVQRERACALLLAMMCQQGDKCGTPGCCCPSHCTHSNQRAAETAGDGYFSQGQPQGELEKMSRYLQPVAGFDLVLEVLHFSSPQCKVLLAYLFQHGV